MFCKIQWFHEFEAREMSSVWNKSGRILRRTWMSDSEMFNWSSWLAEWQDNEYTCYLSLINNYRWCCVMWTYILSRISTSDRYAYLLSLVYVSCIARAKFLPWCRVKTIPFDKAYMLHRGWLKILACKNVKMSCWNYIMVEKQSWHWPPHTCCKNQSNWRRSHHKICITSIFLDFH